MSALDILQTLPAPVVADYERLKQQCIGKDSRGIIAVDDAVLAEIPDKHLRALHDAALISAGFDEDFTIQLFAVEELLTDESPIGGLSFVALDAREYMTI